jgi:hypothetical protein
MTIPHLPAAWARGATLRLDAKVDVTPLGDGSEAREGPGALRRRWTLPERTRPVAEARACLAFFEGRSGALHPFAFTDPVSGVVVVVRFAIGPLEMTLLDGGQAKMGAMVLDEVFGETL